MLPHRALNAPSSSGRGEAEAWPAQPRPEGPEWVTPEEGYAGYAEAARQAAGVPSLEATALAPQLPRSPPPLQAQALAQAQAQAQASSSSTPPVLAVRAGHADGDIEATAQPVVAEAKQGASSDGQQQQQQQQHSPAPEVATPLLRASCRGLQVSFDPASGRGGLVVGEEGVHHGGSGAVQMLVRLACLNLNKRNVFINLEC